MGALLLPVCRAVMASAMIAGAYCAPVVQAQDIPAPASHVAADTAPPQPPADAATTETPAAATPIGDATATEPATPLDHLPAGTIIEIRVDEPVNSKTHKTGDWYAISLSRPIMLGDAILVPAGTPGRGQVVHAAKSSWGGKAGELILGARYLEYDGRQIALRGMKLGGVGDNNEGIAFATMVAGGLVATPLVFAINGKNADIQTGMLATAKLTADMFPPPATAPLTETAATPAAAMPVSDAQPVTVPEEIKSKPTKQEDL